MSKSIWSILAIGAGGVILLALMMKHLAGAVVERERSPYAAAVEARMGSKLLGRVRITKRYAADAGDASDAFTLHVLADVVAGVDKKRLAERAGQEVWLGAMRAGDRPEAVWVTLYERDDDVAGEAYEVAPPGQQR